MALTITTGSRYEPQYDGNRDLPEAERISCAYRTMTVEDVLTVQQETGVNLLTGDSADGDQFRTSWGVIRAVLTKYASDWRGIQVNGEQLSDSDKVLATLSMHHLRLFAEVFQAILVASVGTEDDLGNFEPGFAQAVPEPDTTVTPAPTSNAESATAAAAS